VELSLPSRALSPNWTEGEDNRLREMYPTRTSAEMAIDFGRSEGAIRNRCYRLGIKGKAAECWTEEEINALRLLYESHIGKPVPLTRFAEKIGRLRSNVSRKARELGLTDLHRKDPEKHWPDGAYKSYRQYETKEELTKALSKARKAWFVDHEHPRGALGMKHSAETRRKISRAVRQWQVTETEEQKKMRYDKAIQTKLERYGTGNPTMLGQNGFSRCKGGKRPDIDNIYFRSAWEANYARYLRFLCGRGEIRSWEYEPKTFVFHGVTRGALTYTPDFLVTENGGKQAWHEVKGWMTSKSKTKLKRMAKYYPEETVIVIGEKEYKALAQYSGLIEGWE
jgi:hypothetical protein